MKFLYLRLHSDTIHSVFWTIINSLRHMLRVNRYNVLLLIITQLTRILLKLVFSRYNGTVHFQSYAEITGHRGTNRTHNPAASVLKLVVIFLVTFHYFVFQAEV
jgi:hypothetical protein